jgi:chromosome segregation ATPase
MKGKMQFLIAASALCLAMAANAQQAPPSKTEPAKPKAKKVWTNDDVTTLRQPSDIYEEGKRKQADEAAAKASQKAATSQSPADKQKPKPKDYLPKTAEEAEKRVAAKQYEIGQQHESIDRAKQEQAEATSDEARAGFQKRIDALTAALDESIAEMHALDGRKQELKSNLPPAPQTATQPGASGSPEVEQLEKRIAEKREKVQSHTEYIEELREAIAKTDSQTTRDALQKKLDGFLALLEKTNGEVKTLEGQLQELKSKPPAPKP